MGKFELPTVIFNPIFSFRRTFWRRVGVNIRTPIVIKRLVSKCTANFCQLHEHEVEVPQVHRFIAKLVVLEYKSILHSYMFKIRIFSWLPSFFQKSQQYFEWFFFSHALNILFSISSFTLLIATSVSTMGLSLNPSFPKLFLVFLPWTILACFSLIIRFLVLTVLIKWNVNWCFLFWLRLWGNYYFK